MPAPLPPVLNRSQTREVDRRAMHDYGMTGLVLMENAGRGVADVLMSLGVARPVVVCCGRGNNAGDGFVIARHLDLRGVAVRVALWGDPAQLAGDAAANFAILAKCGLPIEIFAGGYDRQQLDDLLKGASWIVDALLGTGAVGEPREPLASVIDQLNARHVPILAVDLPSGLDCDTGRAGPHTIRAAHTCTFVAAKPGFFAPGADNYTGKLHVLDIGAPRKLIDDILTAARR